MDQKYFIEWSSQNNQLSNHSMSWSKQDITITKNRKYQSGHYNDTPRRYSKPDITHILFIEVNYIFGLILLLMESEWHTWQPTLHNNCDNQTVFVVLRGTCACSEHSNSIYQAQWRDTDRRNNEDQILMWFLDTKYWLGCGKADSMKIILRLWFSIKNHSSVPRICQS